MDTTTPKMLLQRFSQNSDMIDITSVISMLEEEGLRDSPRDITVNDAIKKHQHTSSISREDVLAMLANMSAGPQAPQQAAQEIHAPGMPEFVFNGKGKEKEINPIATPKNSNEGMTFPDFQNYLSNAPSEALHDLVRLPPTYRNLDLVNQVLTAQSTASLLVLFAIDRSDIARQFLEHALRQMEPAAANPAGPVQSPDAAADAEQQPEGLSKEDAARSATLLTVFLRNVLARGVLRLDDAWFDIQELCVRFIWVPAVLEFRKWLREATMETLDAVQGETGSAPGAGMLQQPDLGG